MHSLPDSHLSHGAPSESLVSPVAPRRAADVSEVTNDPGASLGVSVSPLFLGCGMTQSSIKRGTYRIHSFCLHIPPCRCTCTRRGRRDTCLDSGKGWFRTGHHLQ